MKFHTTQKRIRNNYNKIICVGFCDLQFLLNNHKPIAYTTRAEGWAADIYDIDNVAIVTGYSPFGNIRPKYDMYHSYEEKARNIIENLGNFKEVESLLRMFIREAIGED